MIGHRGEYEYLGKFAAWLDTAVNFIPARLTALLFWLSALFVKSSAAQAWKVAFRDHSQTESPNAGWPMAVMAGALGVRFERAGHYKLGEPYQPLTADVITQAVKLFKNMALLLALASLAMLLVFVIFA
jgi:adenosylcobinamide-phosphate synthase